LKGDNLIPGNFLFEVGHQEALSREAAELTSTPEGRALNPMKRLQICNFVSKHPKLSIC